MPAKMLMKDRDKKFRLLFMDHPQPMWVFDLKSQAFLEVNAAAAALYGYTQEEFRGMRLPDVQVEEDTQQLTDPMNAMPEPATRIGRHPTKNTRLINGEIALKESQQGGRKAGWPFRMDVRERPGPKDKP